jgi:tetratricopeptide (TPR) repeat protein
VAAEVPQGVPPALRLQELDLALKGDPGNIELLLARGEALTALQYHDAGIENCHRILERDPGNVLTMVRLGDHQFRMGRLDDALGSYQRIFHTRPQHLGAQILSGIVLDAMGKYEEALGCYQQALAIDKNNLDALNNLGVMYAKLFRFDDAIECYDRALAIKPDFVAALVNRGAAQAALGGREEALRSFKEALMIQPDDVQGNLQLGLCLLAMGQLEKGFTAYEWRWRDKTSGLVVRRLDFPRWVGGEDLTGKSVFVYAEQGLGDVIQFSRFALQLSELGAKVTLEVSATALPLLAGMGEKITIVPPGEIEKTFDFHSPLLSLPLALDVSMSQLGTKKPYLSSDSARTNYWSRELRARDKLLVGVCWRGNPRYKVDGLRSVTFGEFAPLMTIPGIRFVGLQKELSEKEQKLSGKLDVEHPGADIYETASIVGALDLVISVDTMWAHWAAAIGRPTWVLLPQPCHWVWFDKRTDSPWYPSVRLFRQAFTGQWKPVIQKVKRELSKLAASRRVQSGER